MPILSVFASAQFSLLLATPLGNMTAVLASALNWDFFCFFPPRLPNSTPTVSQGMPAEFGRLLTPCVALSRGGVESSCVTVTLRLPVRPHPFAHHEGSSLGEPIKSSWMSSWCSTWLLDVLNPIWRSLFWCIRDLGGGCPPKYLWVMWA